MNLTYLKNYIVIRIKIPSIVSKIACRKIWAIICLCFILINMNPIIYFY